MYDLPFISIVTLPVGAVTLMYATSPTLMLAASTESGESNFGITTVPFTVALVKFPSPEYTAVRLCFPGVMFSSMITVIPSETFPVKFLPST